MTGKRLCSVPAWNRFRPRGAVPYVLVWMLIGAGGCGGAPAIDPGADLGRVALDAALTAWKSGAAVGPMAGSTPPVTVVDSVWGSGRKLKSFEIREAEPGVVPPRWSVTLELEGQPQAVETHYVLVGTDPIWVYQEDDFTRTLNMDNNPTAAPAKSRGRR